MFFPNIGILFTDFIFFLPEIYLIFVILSLLIFVSFIVLPLNTYYVKEELYLFFYDLIFSLFCILFFFFYVLDFLTIPLNFLFHMAVLVDYFSHSLTIIIIFLTMFVLFSAFEF
jgi:hypothetical protein